MKRPKTMEARQMEVQQLTFQLRDLGLPEEVIEPLLAAMRDFVETGQGHTASFGIPAMPVKLDMLLSNQEHITSYIRVRPMHSALRSRELAQQGPRARR